MKKTQYKYAIVVTWSEEDKGWGIKVPELPGCFSFAAQIKDTPKMAFQVIESWIGATKKKGLEIPEPASIKEYSGKFITRINPDLHRELALKAKLKGGSINRLVEEILNDSLK